MKLIFDSATEYFEFLDQMFEYNGYMQRKVQMIEGPSQPLAPEVKVAITGALDDAQAALAGLAGVPGEQAADKPKRTRKPKAGDAPMAEQPAAQWPSSPTLAEMQSADNPDEQPGSEPTPVTDEQRAAFAAEAQAAAGAIDPAKLAERVAALGAVDPAKHLTAARMFIAAHQLPAYHQVQRDAGLPDDIIGYTDEQRTIHMAAMEVFNEAHDQAQVQK